MTVSLLCNHDHSFLFVIVASSQTDVPTEGPWQAGSDGRHLSAVWKVLAVDRFLALGVSPLASYCWGPFSRRAALEGGCWSDGPIPATFSGAHYPL